MDENVNKINVVRKSNFLKMIDKEYKLFKSIDKQKLYHWIFLEEHQKIIMLEDIKIKFNINLSKSMKIFDSIIKYRVIDLIEELEEDYKNGNYQELYLKTYPLLNEKISREIKNIILNETQSLKDI